MQMSAGNGQTATPVDAANGPAMVAAAWLSRAHDMDVPPEVVVSARTCLIDWFACTLAGTRDPLIDILRRRLREWAPTGSAPLLVGGQTTPPFAAMLHSAAAHAVDFDDTHIWTDAHFGGPTWSAVFSQLKQDGKADDQKMMRAFVAGFEVGARIGGRRMGHALLHRGFQATGMLGRLSAAAACSVMKNLDAGRSAVALTAAGCQTSGLSTTVGTMMKPFQGGKTAFDAVIAADLAAEEAFTADPSLFEIGGGPERVHGIGGLARAFVQDGFAEFAAPDYSSGWEILRNSIKPYPCLYSLNPVADAALELAPQISGRPVSRIRIFVGPSVPKVARYSRPATSHEGRFSVEYIAALGLLGSNYRDGDFEPEVMGSAPVQQLLSVSEVVPTEGRKMFNAAIEVTLASDEVLNADVPFVRGHPNNQITETELRSKFTMLVEPVIGARTSELFVVLSQFPRKGSIQRGFALCREGRSG